MKTQIVILGLAACVFSPLVYAGDSGIYAGIAAGSSAIVFNADDFYSPSPSNARDKPTVTRDTGYKLYVGYNFNKIWGIEGGYMDFGNFQFRSTNVDTVDTVFDYSAHSWSLTGKGSLPVSERVSLFAKLGASLNTARNNYWVDSSHALALPLAPETVISQPTLAASIKPGKQSNTMIAPLLGVGVEYAASKDVKVRLEYEDYGKFGGQTTTGRANISMTSLGVAYLF